MNRLTLYKFDPLAGQEVPGIVIEIVADMPEFGSLERAKDLYDTQAEQLVDALKNNLPQGTLFRVLYKLMASYAKNVLYRGKHGT